MYHFLCAFYQIIFYQEFFHTLFLYIVLSKKLYCNNHSIVIANFNFLHD